METKDKAVTTYRSHRVGSITAGICMIGYGVMFLLHLLLDMVDYRMMFSMWPVILIILGLELLCSNFSTKKIVYDKAAIFLLILMTFFAMGMGVADECFRWAEFQMWK